MIYVSELAVWSSEAQSDGSGYIWPGSSGSGSLTGTSGFSGPSGGGSFTGGGIGSAGGRTE